MGEKKNVPIRTDAVVPDTAAYNKYYMRVASRFGVAKWITLLLFTVYLLTMLALGRSSITYENFMYLLRDFNLTSGTSGAYSSIPYEEQQNMSFAEYKNALAVAGSAGVRLYDGSGNAVFRDSTSYKSPVLLTGERYMLLYDEGGRDYSVMTTIARVDSGTTDGDILCGAVSDSGNFAIVSRTSEAHYVVDIFDASLKNIERVYRDAYITGAAFDGSGEHLAVLTAKSENWSLSSELILIHVGTEEIRSVPLGDYLPLRCQSMDNGNWAIVCDTAVLILSKDGNLLTEYPITSMTLSYFHVSDRVIGLICSENVLGNSSRILVLDSSGHPVIDVSVDRKISGVFASGSSDAVCLLYDDQVEYVSTSGVQSVSFTGNLIQICEISGHIVLCFPGGAYAADFQ